MNPKCVVEQPCFPTDKVVTLEREIRYCSWCFLGNSWEPLPGTDGEPTYRILLLNSYLQNGHRALAGRDFHPSQVPQVFCLWTVLCGVFQVFIIMLYIGLHCDELINIPKAKVSKGLAHFLFKDFAILPSRGLHSQQDTQVRNEVRTVKPTCHFRCWKNRFMDLLQKQSRFQKFLAHQLCFSALDNRAHKNIYVV